MPGVGAGANWGLSTPRLPHLHRTPGPQNPSPAGGPGCSPARGRRVALCSRRPEPLTLPLRSLSFITDHKSGMNTLTCVLLSTYNI